MTFRNEQLKKSLSEKLKIIAEEWDEELQERFGDDDNDEKKKDDEDDEDDDDDDEKKKVDEKVSVKGSGELETDGGTSKNKDLKGKHTATGPKGDKWEAGKVKESILKKYDDEKKSIDEKISKDIDALLSGENDLSEDFVKTAKLIFETAIASHVKVEAAKLEELADSEISEQVCVATEALIESVDGYLDHAVQEYMKENELAIESGIKTDITEGLIADIKEVFEAHGVDVPEGKDDLVEELGTLNNQMETKLDETISENISMKKELATFKKKSVIDSISENLADTEKEKLSELAESIEYEDKDSFRTKLVDLKESYFNKKTEIVESEDEDVSKGTNNTITEDSKPKTDPTIDPVVAAYAKAISDTISKQQ